MVNAEAAVAVDFVGVAVIVAVIVTEKSKTAAMAVDMVAAEAVHRARLVMIPFMIV
jgi:hypothetical protein